VPPPAERNAVAYVYLKACEGTELGAKESTDVKDMKANAVNRLI